MPARAPNACQWINSAASLDVYPQTSATDWALLGQVLPRYVDHTSVIDSINLRQQGADGLPLGLVTMRLHVCCVRPSSRQASAHTGATPRWSVFVQHPTAFPCRSEMILVLSSHQPCGAGRWSWMCPWTACLSSYTLFGYNGHT